MFYHRKDNHWWFIVITILFGFALDIFPLHSSLMWLRPAWTLLIILYWLIKLPETLSVLIILPLGLILDLLKGTLLGEHALALLIVSYVVMKFAYDIYNYSLRQQMLVIGGVILLYHLIILCVQGVIHQLPPIYLYLLSVLVSTLLWPWIFVSLNKLFDKLHLS
jgi:rod shape-determining protein MreD